MKQMVKLRWLMPSFLSVSLIAPAVQAAPAPNFNDNNPSQNGMTTAQNIPIDVPPPKSQIAPLYYNRPVPPPQNQVNDHDLDDNILRSPGSQMFAGVVPLHSPIKALEPQIRSMMARYPYLKSGMFFLDLDTGNYLDLGGDTVFPAASTIKLPILAAFFQDVDAGKINMDEVLTMRGDLVANGSGDMQYQPVGTKFTARQTVIKMITISDNTATNMIIDRMGGIARLNQRFRSWGLKDTVIHHLLGDFRGTNVTSAKDLSRVLAWVVNDNAMLRLSPLSKERVLYILRNTTVKTLLPAGLGRGAVIADKTGDIGFLVGDAGYITTPNGKHYLAAIFVRRPYDDPRVRSFVSGVSRLVYNYVMQQNPVAEVNSPNFSTP